MAVAQTREAIPAEDGGGGRWSVDHLFIDQDGVPTLVEVKRQSDTRRRREVVGQMLDYAANAVVYWPVDQLRSEFEADCQKRNKDPVEEIGGQLGADIDSEALWQQVKTNLQAGRIRMLFVADRIPPELKRIVEFLNQQMDPAEVLALELRQFTGEGLKTIVPMVYGQTEGAREKKGAGSPVNRSVAAYRAHMTRLRAKLDKAPPEERVEIEAKIVETQGKIAELQQNYH